MKITTLIENLVYQPGLVSEHGLSFYIDTGRRRILFDTGQSDAFISNAKALDINIGKVDAVVISHGHYDHTGGLNAFLRENTEAPVYLKKEALNKKYNSSKNFIGTAEVPGEFRDRLVFVEEMTEIDEGVFIFPNIPVKNNVDTSFEYFFTNKGQGMEQDEFDDELFLAITNNERLSILSSCSHRGISNIIEEARKLFHLPVHLITGGFHLKNAPKDQFDSVTGYLFDLKPEQVGICHCTGVEHFPQLSKESGGRVFYNYTGNTVKI